MTKEPTFDLREYIRQKNQEAALRVTTAMTEAGITFVDTGTMHVVRLPPQRGMFETLLSLTPDYRSRHVKYRTLGSAHSRQGEWTESTLTQFLALYGYRPDQPEMVVPTLVSFGKYKNKTYLEIARTDPQYLQWVLTSNFKPEQHEAASLALAEATAEQPEAVLAEEYV